MFDFIKRLFKKPSKKRTKKKVCASCNAKTQSTLQNERNVKREEKIPVCAPVLEAEPTVSEKTEISPEVKNEPKTEKSSEPVVDEPVQISVEESEAEEKILSGSQYVIKLVKKDTYRFELVSNEGKTVIKSGEYTLKRSCVSGIQSVRKNGATENMEDRTLENPTKAPNPKYELTVDENSKYHFTLKAPNGYVILTSSAYSSKKACVKAIEAVKANSLTETVNDMTK